MVLHQSKFYIRCYKSKYFRVIFQLLKYYQNEDLQTYLYYQNNNMFDF